MRKNWKKLAALTAAVILGCTPYAVQASAPMEGGSSLNFTTGGDQGTYYGFGGVLAGKIDAAFIVAGAPTTAVTSLAATKPVKLISLDEEHINKLIEESPYYSLNVIPKDAYGTEEDVQTVAVGAVVIAQDDVAEADVYNFLYGVFENIEDITAAHAKGAELDLNFAASVTTIGYHPGAVKYFAEKGIEVPAK